MGRRYFLLLASPERNALFEGVLSGQEWRAVPTVREAVRHCVSDPPAAILMDFASTLHSGVAETAPLHELEIDLPILRCTGGGDSPWTAMCQAPFRRLPLEQAVEEIARGEVSWKHPTHPRRFVRVGRNARILFRPRGSEGGWTQGNAQSMSVSGLFVFTREPAAVGTDLEVRILDCAPQEIALQAAVSWVHLWEDGPHLPGIGLDFDRSTVPDSLGDALADAFLQSRPR